MKNFGYKSADFYTQYFDNLLDFKVLEHFQLSTDKEEKNTFIGKVEVLNTIHPLELRVEIPVSFPHHKLTFRTKSLSGYPHLIHTGKIQYGDWFCLNTPFAETAEEQLEQEVSRLKEWIVLNMREEIPAIIKDQELKEALVSISRPEWMHPDAIKEVETKAVLTFIGKFASSPDDLIKPIGKFHCLRTPDNRFYAFKEKYQFSTYDLPYAIVDFPKNIDILDDFLSLRDYYDWDENTCKHLLPGYEVSNRIYAHHSLGHGVFGHDGIDIDEESALQQIESLKEKLSKDEPYLNPLEIVQRSAKRRNLQCDKVLVPPSHIDIILNEIDIIEKNVRNSHGIKEKPHRYSISEEDWTEDDWEDAAREDNWFEREQYLFNYFVLGFKLESEIYWMIFYTNHASLRFDQKKYNIEIGTIFINEYTSLRLDRCTTQILDESMFFGRGALCDNIKQKRVALIGLGAIGSMVAEALAHAGIQKIGLWDSDTIEPGNICRSTYSLQDLGESKVQAIAKKIRNINPFIDTNDINASGKWMEYIGPNDLRYSSGSFYDNINYTSQEDAINKIKDYNLVIDCTGRNEILHFISYALPDTDIISLAITNKARELICISSRNGNPFELRKAYLSAIAQNTTDYYVEGSGCYEPTFKATYFDICSLVNLCIRELNTCMAKGRSMTSTIFRYNDRGIIADRLHSYQLQDSDIILNIPNEVLWDAEDLPESFSDYLGFILGSYSKDGKQIMITQIIAPEKADEVLSEIFESSKGIIDYIGDVAYSGPKSGSIRQASFDDIAAKAADKEINTNNPLLAVRNPEGDFSFFLYFNDQLIPFFSIDI
ncbi:MAG: ThiF family adenylyltransferase [Muribaculaceae bacterium]|nr:ThiF family adenylyltransferase [Muribaculaceae bacterium]